MLHRDLTPVSQPQTEFVDINKPIMQQKLANLFQSLWLTERSLMQ